MEKSNIVVKPSSDIVEKTLLQMEYCHERIYNMYIRSKDKDDNLFEKRFKKILKVFNSCKM
jgi:hypothetical protein